MKTDGGQKNRAEETFSAVVVVVLMLILPLWGATVMMVGSVIGMFAYVLLFREQLRTRGWLTPFLALAVAGAIAAMIAVGGLR